MPVCFDMHLKYNPICLYMIFVLNLALCSGNFHNRNFKVMLLLAVREITNASTLQKNSILYIGRKTFHTSLHFTLYLTHFCY